MTIDIDELEFVPYREAGQEVPGVGFWIKKRLGWEDFTEFLKLATTIDEKSAAELDRLAAFLVDRGFSRYEGVTRSGQPLSKEEWRRAPHELQTQMVQELQRRNMPKVNPQTKKVDLEGLVDHPNFQTPSEPSSAASEVASKDSTPISEPSSTTPNTSPTE